MTLPDDQLRRLLDGEIDAGELAGDRVMASIADRVFGVKVDPAVRPVKPRDAAAMGQESGAPAAAQPEMLVEIIPGGGAPCPPWMHLLQPSSHRWKRPSRSSAVEKG